MPSKQPAAVYFKRYPQAWSEILLVQNIGQLNKKSSYLRTLPAPVASNAHSLLRKMAVGPISGAIALILLSRLRTKALTSFRKSQRDPSVLLQAFSLITCLCVARPLSLEHLPFAEKLNAMRQSDVRAAILSDEDVPPDQPGVMANVYGLLAAAAPRCSPSRCPSITARSE